MPTGRVVVTVMVANELEDDEGHVYTAPPRTYSFGFGLIDSYDRPPKLTIHPWGEGSALVVQRVWE